MGCVDEQIMIHFFARGGSDDLVLSPMPPLCMINNDYGRSGSRWRLGPAKSAPIVTNERSETAIRHDPAVGARRRGHISELTQASVVCVTHWHFIQGLSYKAASELGPNRAQQCFSLQVLSSTDSTLQHILFRSFYDEYKIVWWIEPY